MDEEKKEEILLENPEVEVEAKPEKNEKKKKSRVSKEAEELEKLSAEFETYKQTHLRVLAEYDNFRKRSNNEKSLIYGNAVSDTVNLILPVADNIDRALAQENATAEDMRKGVELISNQFAQCFEKLGITPIGVVGEEFDPELHNAVSHIDSEDLSDNTIAAVFQKGYRLGKKVVRHAMVQVAN